MNTSKKTVVIGASDNSSRYSYVAVNRLLGFGHEVVPIGSHQGRVGGLDIVTEHLPVNNVDTVTLYLNPKRQAAYYDYIISLNPKRVIFNPGTENEELESLLKQNGIEAMEACTLVMLNLGRF